MLEATQLKGAPNTMKNTTISKTIFLVFIPLVFYTTLTKARMHLL